MSDPHDKLPWTQPGWREEASAWIQAELGRRGIMVVGVIEQPHLRPWSTVLRVPTSAGDHYFKATSLLEDVQALMIDRPDGLTGEQYARLRAFAPQFADMCARLAAYGIPETLHHDDFHDGNIFLGAGGLRFFDWGESCAAQPFYTLVVGLRGIAYRFELAEDAPELRRLRDIYLEPWTRYTSRANLLEACALAQPIGSFCRALTWHRVVANLESPLREEQQDAVPGWLQVFLDVLTNMV